MKILKNLELYTPENPLPGLSVLYLRDEDGRDWYEQQKEFSPDTVKFVFDKSGVIRSVSKDVSKLWPVEGSVAELDEANIPEGFSEPDGWVFDGERITARTYSAKEWQAKAESQRQSLLADASKETEDWRTELQLDIITDEDKAELVKWMTYIKALKALDLSNVSKEEDYRSVLWPQKPS